MRTVSCSCATRTPFKNAWTYVSFCNGVLNEMTSFLILLFPSRFVLLCTAAVAWCWRSVLGCGACVAAWKGASVVCVRVCAASVVLLIPSFVLQSALFLYDLSARSLHGVFEPTAPGIHLLYHCVVVSYH